MRRDEIDGIVLHIPTKLGDNRGYFAETYNRSTFSDLGIAGEFVQDNESLSTQPGTIRGLHFQVQPSPQGKLVRCTRGAVLDVSVDLRIGSATYGDHFAVQLDSDAGAQLWIPPGFAHGYCTLEPDSVIAYKVSAYYDPAAERSILWNDPDLGIDWPVVAGAVVLSTRDEAAPTLAEFGSTSGLF